MERATQTAVRQIPFCENLFAFKRRAYFLPVTHLLALLDSTLYRIHLFSTHWLIGSQLTVLRFVLAPYKAFAFAFFFAFSLLLTVAALFW